MHLRRIHESAGSVNQAPNRQRAMTPNTSNGHIDMNRAQMSQSRADRRMEDGRQQDDYQHKGGFMSLICCR